MRSRWLKSERLLALVLSGFILAISLGGYQAYKRQQAGLEQAAIDQLNAIADLKASQIVRWRQERLNDAAWVMDSSLVNDIVRNLLTNPSAAPLRDKIFAWMAAWQKNNHYGRVLLLDKQLQARLSSPAGQDWIGSRASNYLAVAAQTNRVLISDLHLSEVSKEVNMDYFVPLWFKPQGGMDELAGVFMFEIDPSEFLYPMLQTWPTPSRSAETLLIRREGDEVVYLNELRHRANTALRLRFPLASNSNLVAARAVQNPDGIIKSVDYRGVPVLAATRRISESPWFIVAKQDQTEVYAPMRQRAWSTAALTGLLVLAASLGIGFLWRSREYQFSQKELEDRKLAEQELRREKEFGRILLENLADGVVACNHEGKLVLFNRTSREWHGVDVLAIPPEQWATHYDLFGPDGETPLRTEEIPLLRAFKGEQVREAGMCIRAHGQPLRHIMASADPFFDAQGGKLGAVAVMRDITERKLAELERERLTHDLRQKNEELENLIYAASHDLRSPLVNIEGFSKRLEKACQTLALLMGNPEVPEPLRRQSTEITQAQIPKALNYISAGVAKMNALIAGLLQLSRLGQAALRLETLDMNQVLRQILTTLAFQIQKAEAVVEIESLPSCPGDALMINQVFSNLIDNSLKYREPSRPLRIRVSGWIDGRQCVYCVADNGIGIAPEYQDKIWELFHRLQPHGPAAGEGLGLSLIRRILNRHNGRVWVESKPGEGSRFYVALPATGKK